MNDTQNRRHQMFARVVNFGQTHAADFTTTSLGAQLFARLTDLRTQLDSHAANATHGIGAAKQGTNTRGNARQALRQQLEALKRTADSMALEIPGVNNMFSLPPANNDQALIDHARSAANDARALQVQFVAHEMPADFIAHINDNITALETSIDNQSTGTGTAINSRASIESAIADGVSVKQQLAAIIKNKYVNDPAVLAEWASASHTERAPRRATPITTITPPAPQLSDAGGATTEPPTP